MAHGRSKTSCTQAHPSFTPNAPEAAAVCTAAHMQETLCPCAVLAATAPVHVARVLLRV